MLSGIRKVRPRKMGISNPLSTNRLGHFLTADCKSAETPSGAEETYPTGQMGAHALGYNAHSIGICYEGGLSPSGCISDTRTPAQKEAMKLLILRLHREFPDIKTILGHRDLPGMQKACPCFDATKLQPLLAS